MLAQPLPLAGGVADVGATLRAFDGQHEPAMRAAESARRHWLYGPEQVASQSTATAGGRARFVGRMQGGCCIVPEFLLGSVETRQNPCGEANAGVKRQFHADRRRALPPCAFLAKGKSPIVDACVRHRGAATRA